MDDEVFVYLCRDQDNDMALAIGTGPAPVLITDEDGYSFWDSPEGQKNLEWCTVDDLLVDMEALANKVGLGPKQILCMRILSKVE